MTGSMMGVVFVEGEVRQVPKFALTLEELIFSFGSKDLVRQLREIGALKPAGKILKRTLLFDAGDAARAWAEYRAGRHDKALSEIAHKAT